MRFCKYGLDHNPKSYQNDALFDHICSVIRCYQKTNVIAETLELLRNDCGFKLRGQLDFVLLLILRYAFVIGRLALIYMLCFWCVPEFLKVSLDTVTNANMPEARLADAELGDMHCSWILYTFSWIMATFVAFIWNIALIVSYSMYVSETPMANQVVNMIWDALEGTKEIIVGESNIMHKPHPFTGKIIIDFSEGPEKKLGWRFKEDVFVESSPWNDYFSIFNPHKDSILVNNGSSSDSSQQTS